MNNIFTILVITLQIFSFSANSSEKLKSQVLREMACQSAAEEFPEGINWEQYVYSSKFDGNFEKLFVSVDEAKCNRSEILVVDKGFKKVGSEELLLSLDVEFDVEDVACKVVLSRGYKVVLKSDKTYVIELQKWTNEEPACKLKYSKALATAQLESPNVTEIIYKDLPRRVKETILVPDHLLMGQPDDSSSNSDYIYYLVSEKSETIGYMASYVYANSEGEMAMKFIFKYNKKGELIGALNESEHFDYEEARFEIDPLDIKLTEEIDEKIRNEAEKLISYKDAEGTHWGIRDIESHKVVKHEKLNTGHLYDVKVEIGMGHEYDESVVFYNDTCIANIFYSTQKKSWSFNGIKNCKVIKEGHE